jgi:hypothetical protein
VKVRECPPEQFDRRLASVGVPLRCGPFVVSIASPLARVAAGLRFHYADFDLLDDPDVSDFDVRVESPSLLRRVLRPQVSFTCDGRAPFKPLPVEQAFPMLEWGLNWVISSHAHDHLVVHGAVLERDGRALILAADPGSGKSTLCAALVHGGWRLLSDELALVDLGSGRVRPVARPISLKNESIGVVRALGAGEAVGEVCAGTAKGAVAHMRPPHESVRRMDEAALPAWIVFPKFAPGRALAMETVAPAHAFMELTRHAFNYALLGTVAFQALAALVDHCRILRAGYGHLDQVVPEIDRLAAAAVRR